MATTPTLTPKPNAHTLKVPGATLYYEVRGSGPTLLLISGGPTDADIFAGLTPFLADTYTVVTYDPRGNSRSHFDGAPEDWQVDVHGDDAACLLTALGDNPAYVFGNSGGALVGLNLAARFPEKVRVVVAHEPPAVALLPDADAIRAHGQKVYETYRREGVGPAMRLFLAGAGLTPPSNDAGPQDGRGTPDTHGAQEKPSPEALESMQRMGRNVELFVAHGFKQSDAYVQNIDALRDGKTRVVIAAGAESGAQLARRAAVEVAKRLGTPLVELPGDHGGFMAHPALFAKKLTELLSD